MKNLVSGFDVETCGQRQTDSGHRLLDYAVLSEKQFSPLHRRLPLDTARAIWTRRYGIWGSYCTVAAPSGPYMK